MYCSEAGCSNGDKPLSTVCSERSPKGYYCTEDVGHEGNHIACGAEHRMEEWEVNSG